MVWWWSHSWSLWWSLWCAHGRGRDRGQHVAHCRGVLCWSVCSGSLISGALCLDMAGGAWYIVGMRREFPTGSLTVNPPILFAQKAERLAGSRLRTTEDRNMTVSTLEPREIALQRSAVIASLTPDERAVLAYCIRNTYAYCEPELREHWLIARRCKLPIPTVRSAVKRLQGLGIIDDELSYQIWGEFNAQRLTKRRKLVTLNKD